MPKLFEVFSIESAIDDAMVAAHHERHAMANDDLIAIIGQPHFCDFSDGQNDTERGHTFSFNEIKRLARRRGIQGSSQTGCTRPFAAGSGDESLEAGNKSSAFSQRH